MITLESLVKEYFPLLEDRFNFSLQKPVSIFVSSNNTKTLERVPKNYFKVQFKNPHNYCTDYFYFDNADQARKSFKKIMLRTVFKGYEYSKEMENIIDICFLSYVIKIQKVLENKEKIKNKLLEFYYAELQDVGTNKRPKKYIRLFDRLNKKLCNVIYLPKIEKYAVTLHRNQVITITPKNIEKCISAYESYYHLNTVQKIIIKEIITRIAYEN